MDDKALKIGGSAAVVAVAVIWSLTSSGMPSCDDSSVKSEVASIIDGLPAVASTGVTVADMMNEKELGATEKSRLCSGTLLSSSGGTVNVNYQVISDKENGGYLIAAQMTQ